VVTYPTNSPFTCHDAGNTGGGKITSALGTCDSYNILNTIPTEMLASLASCAYTQLSGQQIFSCPTCDVATTASATDAAAAAAAGTTARRLQQHSQHRVAEPAACGAADMSGCQEPEV
jgi:hypothetical protein